MKKLLLGAAAIDRVRGSRVRGRHAARAPIPRPRPIPRPQWSTTGPVSISAAMSAAPSLATTACRAATAASWAACRAASTISSHPTGWSVPKPSTAGWPATTTMACCSRPARWSPAQQRPARLGHRPARLHLGSGAALRQGRLRLARQQQSRRQHCRRAAALHHQRQPQGRLHRRRRSRIHVRAELVGQGRVPVLQFRQHHLHRPARPTSSAPASATTSTPSRSA